MFSAFLPFYCDIVSLSIETVLNADGCFRVPTIIKGISASQYGLDGMAYRPVGKKIISLCIFRQCDQVAPYT